MKVYQEKASAASAERPKLKRAIGALDAGDVLMVTATDRLARNTRDLLNILHAVKEAGAGFRSIGEPMVDTTSQFAEVVIAVLGIAASWKRQRIVERTAVGRDHAKASGVKFGWRAALTPHQQAEALQRLARGDTQRTVAALLGVDQATISRLARKSVGYPWRSTPEGGDASVLGTVRNFVREAIGWNGRDHRYGNRQGRFGPASGWP